MIDRAPHPQITTLESGVRVATEAMPSVRSIALGFWIRAGSRDEDNERAGISHFLEHLLFKGTDRYSSLEIDEAFDAMGAEVNAGTGKETTSVYSRFLDGHLERAFDLLQDMVLHPAYPDIDSERQVVIEEIAMYEDEPQDKVHDVLAGALFGEHPLGRPIIGRAEVVSSVPVPSLAAWHDSRYVPGGIVVAAAGNVDHDRLVGLVEGAFAGAPSAAAPAGPGAPAVASERLRFHRKDTEQYHLCLGAPGIPRGDDRRFALRILDMILGGSTSSRLFQEVREKRGLCYTISAFHAPYLDIGMFGIYAGTDAGDVDELMRVVAEETAAAASGITEAEVDKAKAQMKVGLLMALESSGARARQLANQILIYGRPIPLEEIVGKIDAVTAASARAAGKALIGRSRPAIAALGPGRGLEGAAGIVDSFSRRAA